MTTHSQAETPAFRQLLEIWLRPRATIRAIVDTNPYRFVWILAAISGIFQWVDNAAKREAGDTLGLTAIVVLALVLGPISGILTLHVAGFLFRATGGMFGGRASGEEVRAALAWSSVPDSFLLLLYIPYIALWGREGFMSAELAGEFTGIQWIVLLLIGVVGLPLTIWKAFISVMTMAEVHRFAWWKGLLTYLVGFAIVLIPVVGLFLLIGR